MFERIQGFVGQCGREFQRRECSVAPQRLEFRQMLHRLAGEFKPLVLVNPRGALGLEAERSNQALLLVTV